CSVRLLSTFTALCATPTRISAPSTTRIGRKFSSITRRYNTTNANNKHDDSSTLASESITPGGIVWSDLNYIRALAPLPTASTLWKELNYVTQQRSKSPAVEEASEDEILAPKDAVEAKQI